MKEYSDIDFDSVKTIDELANIYSEPPYGLVEKCVGSLYESVDGVLTQYKNSTRNNDDNSAFVLYLERNMSSFALINGLHIKIKSMWFDEDGNRVERPIT